MYGSWYCGSQASSWIFWWAFARLCRLTSTPHVGGGGLGRRRRTCGSAFSVPRKPGLRGRRGPRRVAGNAVRCPRRRIPRGTDHSGSPGREWSQYETSQDLPVPRVDLHRVRQPGVIAQRRSVPRGRGRGRVSVPKRSGAKPRHGGPVIELPAPGSGPEIARARTLFLIDEPLVPGVVREPILASWTRSRLWEIRPDDLELPLEPGADDDTTLPRAAEPVLREVADLFATEPVSVIL